MDIASGAGRSSEIDRGRDAQRPSWADKRSACITQSERAVNKTYYDEQSIGRKRGLSG